MLFPGICAEIIGKACGWHYLQEMGVELFKGGLFLERGDYSTYAFMEIYVSPFILHLSSYLFSDILQP